MSRRLGLVVVAAILAIVAWPATCDAIASVAVAERAETGAATVVDVGVNRPARWTMAPTPSDVEVRVSHIASATALRSPLVVLVILALAVAIASTRPRALLVRRWTERPAPLAIGWGTLAPSRAPPAS